MVNIGFKIPSEELSWGNGRATIYMYYNVVPKNYASCPNLQMGHSSQNHLGSVSKVLKNSSNFHHFLVSLREVNPENFRSLALTVYFLEAFKVFRILQNFCILRFLLILEA